MLLFLTCFFCQCVVVVVYLMLLSLSCFVYQVRDLMSSFRMMVKIVQDFIKDHQFRVNLKTEENVQMVGEMLQ